MILQGLSSWVEAASLPPMTTQIYELKVRSLVAGTNEVLWSAMAVGSSGFSTGFGPEVKVSEVGCMAY